MKSKIGFVAIGQAGGNIGRLLEEKGYSVLFVNTSKEDLDTLHDVKYRYHIPDGEGCNKDRSKAKKLIIDNYDSLSKEISEKINKDMLFVIFSSGGGTGSGVGPMLIDLLSDDKKTVGAITVLPGQTESLKSHINAYECFCELTEIYGMASTFILDNDKNPDKLKLNSIFVNMFTRYLDIPAKYKSEKGNIDKAEIEETLKSRGMTIISSLGESNGSVSSLISSFSKNIFAPIEDDRVIKYISLSGVENINIKELEKVVGTPIDTFRTYNEASTICMLAGLSYPQKRLDIIHTKVMDNKEVIKKNLSNPAQQKMKNDINFLNEFSIKPDKVIQTDTTKVNSIRDKMSKYLKN
jgi:cell division GTPase FtsZ